MVTNPKKAYNLKSIFNTISGEVPVKLNKVSDEELNLYSKNNVDQEKLSLMTKGRILEDTNEIKYIDSSKLVKLSELDGKSLSNTKSPLEVKLSIFVLFFAGIYKNKTYNH